MWNIFNGASESRQGPRRHEGTEARLSVLDTKYTNFFVLRGSSTFTPKFQAYFQRWFAKKLQIILRNGFLYFISILLDFKKITSKQLFFQNRDLEAPLTAPPLKRHSRLCGTISLFRFFETKKTKKCLNVFWSFLKNTQIFQNGRRFN